MNLSHPINTPASIANSSKKRRRPSITALESRILLDGAALIEAHQAFDAGAVFAQTGGREPSLEPDLLDLVLTNGVPLVSEPARRELVFIDASLPDVQTLISGVADQAHVHLIQPNEDGLARMIEVLRGQTGVDAIHILGHGSAGEAVLGTTVLNTSTLTNYSEQLSNLGLALTPDGDILLYGCNIAADATGEYFVEQLAKLTQADVAASSDLTGNALLGGDWDLEIRSGEVESDEIEVASYDFTLPTATVSVGYTATATSRYTVDYTVNGSTTYSYGNPSPNQNANGSNATRGELKRTSDSANYSSRIYYRVTGTGGQPWEFYYDDTGGYAKLTGTGDMSSYSSQAFDADQDTFFYLIIKAAPNTAPTASNTSVTVNEGTTGSVSLYGLVSDNQDSDSAMSYAKVSGSGSVSEPNATYTAGANTAKKGTEVASMTYRVTDTGGLSATGTITWNVNYADDPTTWTSTPADTTLTGSGAKSFNWKAGASDPDDTVTYTYVSGAPGGDPATAYNYGVSQEGTYTVNVKAVGSTTVTDSFQLTISNANDKPTALSNTETINEDSSYVFTAADFRFSDADQGTLYNTLDHITVHNLSDLNGGTLALVGGSNAGALSNGNQVSKADIDAGYLVFTTTPNFNGSGSGTPSNSFRFKVSDGLEYSGSFYTQFINVTAIADQPSVSNTTVDEDTQSTTGLVIDRNAADGAEVTHFKISNITGGTLYKNDGTTVISNNSFITYAEGLAGLKFTPSLHSNAPGSFDVAGATNAGGAGLGPSATATITVNPVNDAPEIAAQSALALTEDVTGNLTFNGAPFTDVDSDLVVTLSVADGVIAAATGVGVTVGGTDTDRTFAGTVVDLNAYFQTAGNITYTTALNNASTRTLTITASDGLASETVVTKTINITAVNDAPVAVDQSLSAIDEDVLSASNPGTAIADLVAGFTDADDIVGGASDQRGIAITGVDSANGSWFYSTNGGASWTSLSGVSSTTARLLAADIAGHRVRFTPAADFNGNASFTFRAWDRQTGTAGGTANVSTNGNTSAFSSGEAVATITVTSVNDAPVIGDVADINMVKDAVYSLPLSASDLENDALTWTVALTGAESGNVTLQVLNNQTVELTPAIGVSGAYAPGDIRVTLTATDAQGAVDTEVFDVLRINSAPTLAMIPDQSLTEETPLSLTLTSTDPENDPVTYSVSGGSVQTITATVSGSTLTLIPAENFYTTSLPVTLTVTAHDAYGATHSRSLDVTVSPVNEAPSFTPPGSGFLTDGTVTTSIRTGHEYSRAMVVQSDGRTVLAGVSSNGYLTLMRYDESGELDTTFSSDGIYETSFLVNTGYLAVAQQSDGKLVVVATDNDDLHVFRFQANGGVDNFGTSGRVMYDLGHSGAWATGVVIQPDGKIVVSGRVYYDTTGRRYDMFVVRLNSNGSLDNAFSTNGQYFYNSASKRWDYAYDLALQADGRVVVVGVFDDSSAKDIGVLRFNTNGTLDTSFSDDGIYRLNLGGTDKAYAVAIQDDGKIVLAGEKSGDFALLRLNADGSLDTSFSSDGIVIDVLSGTNRIEAVAIQPDGKIVVGGFSDHDGAMKWVVARYNSDGSRDSTFADDGLFVHRFRNVGNDSLSIRDIAVMADGSIVAGGYAVIPTDNNYGFAMLRLTPSGALAAAPVNTLDGTPSFTENGAAVVLDADVAIYENDLSILNNGAGNFAGASLTIARNGGANANDLFDIDLTGTPLTSSGGNLQYNGSTFATWSQTDGSLTVLFTSGETIATTEWVNLVMRSMRYANTSDNPVVSVQLDWIFSDGNTGSQGSGGALTVTGSTTVAITAVNDAPTITSIANQTLAENDAPISITLSASDPEGQAITYTVSTSQSGVFGATAGNANQIALSVMGNQLTIAPRADYSNDTAPLRVWVKATDAGGETSVTAFDVLVQGVNAAPEFGAGDGIWVSSTDAIVSDITDLVELPDGDLLALYQNSGSSSATLLRLADDGTRVQFASSEYALSTDLLRNGASDLGNPSYIVFSIGGDSTYKVSSGQSNAVLASDGADVSGSLGQRNVNSAFDGSIYHTFNPVGEAINLSTSSNAYLVAAIDYSNWYYTNSGRTLNTNTRDSGYKDPYLTLSRFAQSNSAPLSDDATTDRAGVLLSTSAGAEARVVDIVVDANNVYAYVITRENFAGTTDTATYDIGIHKFDIDGTVQHIRSGAYEFGAGSTSLNDVHYATIDSTGGIIVGFSTDSSSNYLMRFNSSNLSVDTQWGTGGKVDLKTITGSAATPTYSTAIQALQMQGDKILVASQTGSGSISTPAGGTTPNQQVSLVRLNSDGSLDTSFGTNGMVSSADFPEIVRSDGTTQNQILIDSNNRINWAFESYDPTTNKRYLAVARLSDSGQIDQTFNAVGALDGTPTYTENGTAVILDENVAVADSELDQLNNSNGNYAGVSLTIERHGGANANDVLAFNTTGASFSLVGNTLQSAGKAFASYSMTNGSLRVNFTSSDTVATRALVNNVMQNITYANSSNRPATGVQLDWRFDDGGANGAQGSGGGLVAVGSTTVTITPVDDAPVFTVADQIIVEDQPGSVSLNAYDPEGNGITYSLSDAGLNATVLATLSGNILTLTPAANFHGSDTITVVASDGAVTTPVTFTVTVTPVNDAPVADAGTTQLRTERTSVNPTAAFYIDSLSVNDVEDNVSGQSVTVVLSSRDMGASSYGELTLNTGISGGVTAADVQGNGTGQITITATVSQVNATLSAATGLQYAATAGMDMVAQGPDTLSLTVTDSAGVSTNSTRSVFVVPAKPTANSQNFVVNEDSGALTIDLSALVVSFNGTSDNYTLGANTLPNQVSNPDGSGGVLSATWAESAFNQKLGVGVLADNSANTFHDGVFTYTPTANANGIDSFLYRFTDSGGATEVAQIAIYVLSVNDAPLLSAISNQVLTEDIDTTITLSATDVENDPITYTVTGGSSSTVLATVVGDRLTLTPAADYETATPITFTVTATDANGATHIRSFSATVTGVADDPRLTIADQTLNEDTSAVIALTGYDPDGGTITYSLVDAGDATTVLATLNGSEIVLTPAINYFGGPVNITVRATDSSGATTNTSFNVNVTSVNDAPVLAAVADQLLIEDTPKSIGLASTDIEGDMVIYSVSGGHANSVSAEVTGSVLNLTPAADFASLVPVTFTLTATDAHGATNSHVFKVTVNAVNDAPYLTYPGAQILTEDTQLATSLSFGDVEGDAVTVTVTGGSVDTVTAELVGTQVVFTPALDYNSTTPLVFSITATDAYGASTAISVDVTVAAVNDAPVASLGTGSLVTQRTQDNPSATFFPSGFTVADLDEAGNVIAVLSSKNLGGEYYGTWTLRTDVVGGLAVGDVLDNGTGQVTMTGTLAQINTTLDALLGVQYTPSNGRDYIAAGADVITLEVTDGMGATHVSSRELYVLPAEPTARSGSMVLYEDDASTIVNLMELVLDLNDTSPDFSLGLVGVGSNIISNPDGSGGSLTTNFDASEASFSESLTVGTLVDDTANTFNDGVFVYTPDDNSSGIDKFLFQYASSGESSEVAQFTVYVLPVNDQPTLTGLTPVTFAENDDINGNNGNLTPQLLDAEVLFTDVDDQDFDGGVLTITGVRATEKLSVASLSHGVGHIRLDGVDLQVSDGTNWTTFGTLNGGDGKSLIVSFNDQASASHIDALLQRISYVSSSEVGESAHNLTIVIEDGDGGSTGLQTLAVAVTSQNDDPILSFIGGQLVNKGESVTMRLSSSDREGEEVTYSVSGGSSSTVLAYVNGGVLTFSPSADYAGGTVNFLITATDASGGIDTESVAFRVNYSPVAMADADSLTEDDATVINGNVLNNDTDADAGDSQTVIGIRSGDLNVAGTAGTLGMGLAGSYGQLTLTSDGNYSYTLYTSLPAVQALAAGESLTDQFVYTMQDANAAMASAVLTITINGANDAPMASQDSNVAIDDGGVANTRIGSDASGNVLDNDRDTDTSDTLIVSSVRLGGVTGAGTTGIVGAALRGTYGALTLSTNGSYTYVLDNSDAAIEALDFGETLSDAFNYTVSDGQGGTSTAALVITIEGANEAPMMGVISRITLVDTANADSPADSTGALTGTDQDVEPLTYAVAGQTLASTTLGGMTYNTYRTGDLGTVYLNTNTGDYRFVANAIALNAASQNTTEQFSMLVSDGTETATRVLQINLVAANDTPVISATLTAHTYTDTSNADSFSPISGSLSSIDRDAGQNAAYSVLGYTGDTSMSGFDQRLAGQYGTLHLNSVSGAYRYTPNAAAIESLVINDTDTFTLRATDEGGAVDDVTLTVTLVAANDRPELSADVTQLTYVDTPGDDSFSDVSGRLSTRERDAGASHTYSITGQQVDTNLPGFDASVAGIYGRLFLSTTSGAYRFVPDESALEGQTAGVSTETFTLNVSDGFLSDSVRLTVYTVGASDQPVITEGSDAVTLLEGNSALRAAGTVLVTDLDFTDSVSLTTTVETNGPILGLTNAQLLAMLTLTPSSVLADSETVTAPVAWAFDSGTVTFDGLDAGETLVLTYTLKATDTGSPRLSTSDTVTVTITGTNDLPTLAVINPVYLKDTHADDVFTQTAGVFDGRDLDTRSVLTYSVAGQISDTSQVGFTHRSDGTWGSLFFNSDSGAYFLMPDDAAIEALSTAASESFTVTVSDGLAQVSQDFRVNINAANDTPELSASVLSVTYLDTSAIDEFATLDGVLSTLDRDVNATQIYSIVGGRADTRVFGYTHSLDAFHGRLLLNSVSGVYSFVPNPTTLNALTEGRHTEEFTLQVSDGSLTDSVRLIIDAVGVSDNPTMTDAGDQAQLLETDTGLSTSGTVTVTDSDLAQYLTVSAALTVSGTGSVSLSDSQLLAMLKLNGSPISTSVLNDDTSISSSVAWHFDSGAVTFDELAIGETLILTYTLTASDNAATPLSDSGLVTITITGTNDNPSIRNDNDSITLTQGKRALTATGSFDVIDLDTADVVNAVATLQVSGSSDLRESLKPSHADLLAMFRLDQTPVLDATSMSRSVEWSFDSATYNFDYLASGETLVLSYTVALSDGISVAGDRTTITITIVGSNDAPVITPVVVSADLIETNAPLTATGSMIVTDADRSDTVVSSLSLAVSGTSSRLDPEAPSATQLLAMLSIAPVVTLDAAEINDTLIWQFDSNGEAFDYLATGKTLILTYEVTATDDTNARASDMQKVVITITGTNDAPVIQTDATTVSWTDGNLGVETVPQSGFDAGVGSTDFSPTTGAEIAIGSDPAAVSSLIQAMTQPGAATGFGGVVVAGGTPLNGVSGSTPLSGWGTSISSGSDSITVQAESAVDTNAIAVNAASISDRPTPTTDRNEVNASVGVTDSTVQQSVQVDTGIGGQVNVQPGAESTTSATSEVLVQALPVDRVVVSVTADGQVRLSQLREEVTAADSGLMVVEFTQSGSAIALTLSDVKVTETVEYRVMLPNGDPAPDWIQIDPATGSISGQMPAGVQELVLKVVAQEKGGGVRTLELMLRIDEQREAQPKQESRPAASVSYELRFEQQLRQAYAQWQSADAALVDDFEDDLEHALADLI